MNYGELKQAIIDDSHRPDLTDFIERFIIEAEGLLRRQLLAFPLRAEITSAERISEGVYNLPPFVTVIRDIKLQGRNGDALARVSPAAIRRLPLTVVPIQYAEAGDGTIEFRGNPSDDNIFDISYYGLPAPLINDSDENDLLTNHETLYIAGAKFFLYLHTQDRELANDELDIFNGVTETLNEQTSRKVGGADIAPAYNMTGGGSY